MLFARALIQLSISIPGAAMLLAMDGLIEIDDEGVARITGSRLAVIDLVMDKLRNRLSENELIDAFPFLSLAHIYAALTYYYGHQAECDTQIADSLRWAGQMRAGAGPSPAAERLKGELTAS
jgi:uncharacterized protein (DUF433 family)